MSWEQYYYMRELVERRIDRTVGKSLAITVDFNEKLSAKIGHTIKRR